MPDVNPNTPKKQTTARVPTALAKTVDGSHVTPPSALRKVSLQRSETVPTEDQALWTAIRNRTDAIAFDRYHLFVDRVLCEGKDTWNAACPPGGQPTEYGSPSIREQLDELASRPGIYGIDAYQLLKVATQAFLLFESGVVIKGARDRNTGAIVVPAPGTIVPGEETRRGEAVTFQDVEQTLNSYLGGSAIRGAALPYLKRIVAALVSQGSSEERLPYCQAILRRRLTCPSLVELVWSYWHEEGMLVQTMNAISLRFQNRRRGTRDPLANLEIEPLRPLNNLLWGFFQDEYNRLTVMRRVYEYDHHYGLTLYGKAVSELASADSRSKFIEAFHNLLYRASIFFQEDADTTVLSDGFPVLNALKEVHVILAEGAHNQFGDLPWTARAEMLIMEWLLARPEMREFLRGRQMVPYREGWMGAVDTMKRLQNWTDVSVNHFRDLGVFGEQILLSIRYGDWIDVNDQEQARNWARYWKPEIQSYIHSYLAATGVDLAADISDVRRAAERYLKPSVHLRNRLAAQANGGALPPAPKIQIGSTVSSEMQEYVAMPAQRQRLLRYDAEE
jgi:hypothetical protein